MPTSWCGNAQSLKEVILREICSHCSFCPPRGCVVWVMCFQFFMLHEEREIFVTCTGYNWACKNPAQTLWYEPDICNNNWSSHLISSSVTDWSPLTAVSNSVMWEEHDRCVLSLCFKVLLTKFLQLDVITQSFSHNYRLVTQLFLSVQLSV